MTVKEAERRVDVTIDGQPFTAYAWLLRHAPISTVVTHQYVNPVVAIALGAALLGEELSWTTAAGAILVIGSVFVAVRKPG